MHQSLLRRVLIAAAALAFVAGCSGNSGSLAPGQSSSLTPSYTVKPGMRVLPGPAVMGPTIVPIVAPRNNAVRGWPSSKRKRRHEILFVGDEATSAVDMFDPRKANPSPEGSITDGISTPIQVAVDKKSTLYVANLGNGTITEYPKGSSSPSVTLSTGLNEPYGLAVDSKGDVFASNLGNNTIVGYKPGDTSPFETIGFSSEGQAVGMGTDAKDNLWVACDTTSAVYEIPAGTSTPQNSGLSGLEGPISVSFGKHDQMFVSNFGGENVAVYAYGSTSPSYTITTGIDGPTLNGVTYSDVFFQTNQDLNVVGYKKGATTPFSTITGVSDPSGIASSALVSK
jgi:streptogramin lyase